MQPGANVGYLSRAVVGLGDDKMFYPFSISPDYDQYLDYK